MLNRWVTMRQRSRALVAAVVRHIGVNELGLAIALLLIARGLWLAWRPGAYLVPGLVLLWIALPSRVAFLVRPSAPSGKRHAAGQE